MTWLHRHRPDLERRVQHGISYVHDQCRCGLTRTTWRIPSLGVCWTSAWAHPQDVAAELRRIQSDAPRVTR